MKKIGWFVFGSLCVLVGILPVQYFFGSNDTGILSDKPAELLGNIFWNIGFYGHIIFGGIALLVGWPQFSKKLREKYLRFHRILGKTYVISVFVSGFCGVYIGFYAIGGAISALGFISLGIVWLITTSLAFKYVKAGEIPQHQKMMIYSYAACFGAVTLRIWIPILSIIFNDFLVVYRIVAWFSWLPNITLAHFIIRHNNRKEQNLKDIDSNKLR